MVHLIASLQDAILIQTDLLDSASILTRMYIDAAIIDKGETHPDIIAAEAIFIDAEADRLAPNYQSAADKYKDAASAAKP